MIVTLKYQSSVTTSSTMSPNPVTASSTMSPNPVNDGTDDLQLGLLSIREPSNLGAEYYILLHTVFPMSEQRRNYENARYERENNIQYGQYRMRRRAEQEREYLDKYGYEADCFVVRTWDNEDERDHERLEIAHLEYQVREIIDYDDDADMVIY